MQAIISFLSLSFFFFFSFLSRNILKKVFLKSLLDSILKFLQKFIPVFFKGFLGFFIVFFFTSSTRAFFSVLFKVCLECFRNFSQVSKSILSVISYGDHRWFLIEVFQNSSLITILQKCHRSTSRDFS